jgi:hypothetical protein
MYIDTGWNLIGVTGSVKKHTSLLCFKGNPASRVLHLGKVKPTIVTRAAAFRTILAGSRLDPGEFFYQSPDGYLRITNVVAASGIIPDPSDSFVIPISYLAGPGVNLSTIHETPHPVE